jgi:nucleotide-binding universal stress UspA family protein
MNTAGRTKGGKKMKLLIATDLLEASQRVIDAVNQRPWPAGSEACVLHVMDLTPFPLGADLFEMARQAAESAVKSISKRLVPSGLKIRTEVLLGAPRSAISEYARNWAADWVVVGSHSSSGVARFLLGSVARSVVRTAPCSVEIVRLGASTASHRGKGLRILLATDGSDCSIVAAKSVASRLWPAATCVKIISVVSPFFPVADVLTGYFEAQWAILPSETIEKTARFRAAEAIAQTDKLLRESSLAEVERRPPLMGDAKAVILDEAAEWGADLIVVGSHGWRGLDRFTMGSVSESVALHAPCSVEVIR